MNGICAGFKEPPSLCNKLLKDNDFHDAQVIFLKEDEVPIIAVFLVCTGIMVTVLVILCCYRRHARREMKMQIND